MTTLISGSPLGYWAYTGVVFLLCLLLFLSLGSGLYRRLYPNAPTSDLVILGFPIGIGLSAFFCALVSWAVGFNSFYVAACILFVSTMLWLMGAGGRQFGGQQLTLRDVNLWLLPFPLIVTFLVAVSFSGFGMQTDQGLAFKDLYATDLLHHMSVFVHLPHGIPPTNPYFSGEPWHYYWISHLVPAFIYSVSGFALFPKDITLLISITYATMFTLLLYVFLGIHFKSSATKALLMFVSLLAYGYNSL